MNLQEIQQKTFPLIKVTSIGLMSGAIGLIGWDQVVGLPAELLSSLAPVLWLARFAIAAHAIEAVIAVVFAASRGQAPLRYGLYTFFVGTVGLIELFAKPQDQLS